ncbi:MAG: hypothetical protein U0L83_04525 [Muribaculaceae bacterium]|nr:hypothetical protein [Muribaculaceae bacterium]
MRLPLRIIRLLPAAAVMLAAGCHGIDDERIPAMPVAINLADAGLWNVYGVKTLGEYNEFIKPLNIPAGFFYGDNTYTGFGGVLLIGGMDPFDPTTFSPLAYDLSCPVECKRDIRVRIDDESLEAVCPVCESRYNVLMGGGASVAGPAYSHKPKYGLTIYRCVPGQLGGYTIRD